MAAIDPTPEYIEQLMHMVHPKDQLTSNGFELYPLSQVELSKKLRCNRCNKRPKTWKPKHNDSGECKGDDCNGSNGGNEGKSGGRKGNDTSKKENCPITSLPKLNNQDSEPEDHKKDSKDEKPPKPTCQWHSGTLKRNWTCCRGHMFAPGCQTANEHDMPPRVTNETVERYQIYRTPPQQAGVPKAIAIAIDCEMGTSASDAPVDGNPELIRVTVLEYFTATPLLDTLVFPDAPILHYNTRYSGVTPGQMNAARRNHTCLLGVTAARAAVWRYANAAVWRYANAATVVVGHDVRNDLIALRWAHGVVVDSLLVEDGARKREAEAAARSRRAAFSDAPGADFVVPVEGAGGAFGGDAAETEYAAGADGAGGVEDEARVQTDGNGGEGGGKKVVDKPNGPGLSLKAVSKLLLDRTIQKSTHDSMEDALASRDIVDYHVIAGMNWLSCEKGYAEAE